MSSKKNKNKAVDEERKPLLTGKNPEIVPGTSGGKPKDDPATPEAPKKSYQSTPTSDDKDKPTSSGAGGSATTATSGDGDGDGGYQSTAGPSKDKQTEPAGGNSSLSRQIFLGMVISLPTVPCGMSLAYSAVSFDSLDLSVDDASWYASLTYLSYPIGSLVVGKLMDQYGRKPSFIAITIVSLIGWLMLSVPSANRSLTQLLLGRMLTGVAGGLASVPASVYAAECLCPDNVKLRSSLVTWSTVALSLGIFLVYMTGAFLEYYNVASIATLISILALILVSLFIPESPVWLNLKGRHGDAEWSEREINIVPRPALQEEPSEWEDSPAPPQPSTSTPPSASTLEELSKPEVYKPLIIMIGFFFFQQFSGVYVVIAYMVDIIRAAGVVTVSPYWLAVVGGAVILCVSLVASVVFPKTGVRSIAAISSMGTGLTMFWIGIYLSTRHIWIGNSSLHLLNWVPVFLILSNIALSTLGFLILPWSMLGEVFPISVKGVAAGIATCAGFIFSFAALKLYPYIQLGLGVDKVFYFFGSVAIVGTIFVITFLPETHGKTLQEILNEFTKKGSKQKTDSSGPEKEPKTKKGEVNV